MHKKSRKRYIALRLRTSRLLTRRDIIDIVNGSVESQLSTRPWTEPRLILYNPVKKIGILQCNHRSVDEIRKLLGTLEHIEPRTETIRTSGTVKSLRDRFHLGRGGRR
jgi:RNase P/RNase MRP subunit POP5